MNAKDMAISVISSLSDNATLDDVIDRLSLVRRIELGMAQADAGDVVDHEELMAELEREDAK
jgi:predicted transcriptional regulator